MAAQALIQTTGNVLADRIVQRIITSFEYSFPNHLCSCYVEGSYADQSAVATSDLDLTLVLHTPLATVHQQKLASDLIASYQHMSTLELDITLTDMLHLQQSADPMFKLGARLFYGCEVRDSIPLMPIALWTRQRMHAAFWLMIHIFQRPQPVAAPLRFPNPDDPFYGYSARPMQLLDGTTILTTRNLIRVAGWIATARIAYQAQRYVVRKRECARIYRQTIGDQWARLLDTIEQRCRQAWQYRIPGNDEEQAELHAISREMLAFENHFLGKYHQFLLDELMSTDVAAQTTALVMLERTWYPDPAILDALHKLVTAQQREIRTTAQQLIKRQSESVSPTTT